MKKIPPDEQFKKGIQAVKLTAEQGFCQHQLNLTTAALKSKRLSLIRGTDKLSENTLLSEVLKQTKQTTNGFLVSKETVKLRRWESETKIWFYQTS